MDSLLKKCERKNNSRLAPGSHGSPGAVQHCVEQRGRWNFIFPPTSDSKVSGPGFPILRKQK